MNFFYFSLNSKFDSKFKLKNALLVVMLCSLFLIGCGRFSSGGDPLRATGFYFDTVISVTLYEGGSEELLNQCMELAGYYEELLSATVEDSDVWKLNHSMGQAVVVDEDTLIVLNTALSYARISDGLVDPSIGGLSSLWNFGSGNEEIIPNEQDIAEALSHVDYKAIMIDGRQVTVTNPKMQIDLGFIAKGFIGDKMKEFLSSKGVTSALINLGGNVVTLGNRPGGTPFRIGIQKPFAGAGSTALTLDISDISVVSSGNYERYFEKDGRLYHHILSTQTGYPAESGLSQVTILSSHSIDGDALSTLCFILGYEKAAQLLENYPDIQAVFITEDGEILYVNF
ncbi:MAG: FAD:protein FMN transferase [Lachnospiraceae bacterium]|nr:FAD:protein FMN transferase [Lachnospiraceae bacterium]